MFSWFRRKPKAVVVRISGATHTLRPGDAIEALAKDRSRLIVTRYDSGDIEIECFGPSAARRIKR